MSFESELTRWKEQTYQKAISRFSERKPEFQTPSGIPLPPALAPSDPDPDYMDRLGFPGE